MSNLDLETFVKQTLIQISKGVDGAANELSKNHSVIISPYGAYNKATSFNNTAIPTKKERNIFNNREIEFDIAVTASEENSNDINTKAKLTIKVVSASIGSDEIKTIQNSTISRVKFSLPIGFAARFAPEL